MKSLQKEQKAQIMEYKPQSAGINLQSPQSDSTPWTLTLSHLQGSVSKMCNQRFDYTGYLLGMLINSDQIFDGHQIST